jgi:2'-5' RNA ligase
VQKAHGRRATKLAADGSHLSGGMIALMPTAADAKRLAVGGGEQASELHLTLFFLGDDMTLWSDDQKAELIDHLRGLSILQIEGTIKANIFGIAHWNAGGDSPSWVWSVGDSPDSTPLQRAKSVAVEAVETVNDRPEVPVQHTPWVAHICAAYTDDLSLAKTLEQRLGPVEFDRVRVSFGDEDTDIPLVKGFTASGVLRRQPNEAEQGVDFELLQSVWAAGVDDVLPSLSEAMGKWRDSITTQIAEVVDGGNLGKLARVSVDPGEAASLLYEQMRSVAQQAGEQAQREAEAQGVKVKKWTLTGRKERLMRRTADAMTDIMASSMIMTAKRRALASYGPDRSGVQVAKEVEQQLTDLSDAVPREAVGASLTAAQNAGRRAVLESAPPGEYYASEILDKSTCKLCRKIDGQQFDSLDKAYADYPTGGYRKCSGMLRCRGMVVGRWPAQEAEVPAGPALGQPGYHALHPGNVGLGLRQLNPPRGGMVGSPGFSEDQHYAAMANYVDDSHDINEWLRNRNLPSGRDQQSVEHDIHALDDLIAIQPLLTEAREVYRGMSPVDLNIGDEFHDPGFSSATDEREIAEIFTMRSKFQGKGQGKILNINLPVGSRALEMYTVAKPGDDHESEWIFPPGSQFKVTGVTPDGYDVELIV